MHVPNGIILFFRLAIFEYQGIFWEMHLSRGRRKYHQWWNPIQYRKKQHRSGNNKFNRDTRIIHEIIKIYCLNWQFILTSVYYFKNSNNYRWLNLWARPRETRLSCTSIWELFWLDLWGFTFISPSIHSLKMRFQDCKRLL